MNQGKILCAFGLTVLSIIYFNEFAPTSVAKAEPAPKSTSSAAVVVAHPKPAPKFTYPTTELAAKPAPKVTYPAAELSAKAESAPKLNYSAPAVAAKPAKVAATPTGPMEPPRSQKMDCGRSHHHPMRITARHLEPNGIGFNQGYTTLEAFFSPCQPISGRWIPFLDLRGHAFNNGKFAANAGLGFRYMYSSRLWGMNSYYDYRNTKHQHYNQFAVGFENLGEIWDFRINGYLPLGRRGSDQYGQAHFGYFQDNYAFLRRKREFVMKGANAEAGTHVNCWKDFPIYFAAGPYYLNGKGQTTWGGQARATFGIFEYLKVAGTVSYDHLFKWIGQGEIGVTIPFGRKRKIKGTHCPLEFALADRAVQPVDRMEIIPVDTKRAYSPAINPATGQPYIFWFVNNTSHSAGTFESPFNTLLAAQTASSANDIIYVFPGDGTSTGMNAGITLQNGQKFFGSGVTQTIQTLQGNVTIPALSTTVPLITNTGNIVNLASGNEVAGFHLASGLSNISILSNPGTNGTNIHNNVFTGTVAYSGINFFGHGTVLITNNQLIGFSTAGQAIRLVVDDSQTMTGESSNNQVTGFQFGIGMNIVNNSTADYQISYNNINNPGGLNCIFWGIQASSTSLTGFSQGIIMGNQISGPSNALVIQNGNTSNFFGSVDVINNRISGYTQNGVLLDIEGNGNLNCNVTSNIIAQSSGTGLSGTTSNGSPTLSLSLVNNSNAGGYSLVNSSGVFNVALTGNSGTLNTTNVNLQ